MALTDEGLIHVPGLCSRYVRLANGARAHYVTAGETGPNVVLLHGGIPGSNGIAGWRYTAPFLAEHGFRVFCPDQPGFGLADTRPEHHPVHGVFSHVEFLEQFADAVGLDGFYLGGNSMGCINAVHYTVRYPHRVIRLAMIAGGIGDHLPLDTTRPKATISWDGSPDTMRKMMSAIIKHPEAITDDLIEMRVRGANLQQESWPKWWHTLIEGGVDPDIAVALSTKDRINRLSIPMVCLYGQDDVILPVHMGEQQEDVLPNVQFFYPEDCGHQGQTDQPEMFNQLFLEFFRDGRISRKTADWAGVSRRRPENADLVEQIDTAAR